MAEDWLARGEDVHFIPIEKDYVIYCLCVVKRPEPNFLITVDFNITIPFLYENGFYYLSMALSRHNMFVTGSNVNGCMQLGLFEHLRNLFVFAALSVVDAEMCVRDLLNTFGCFDEENRAYTLVLLFDAWPRCRMDGSKNIQSARSIADSYRIHLRDRAQQTRMAIIAFRGATTRAYANTCVFPRDVATKIMALIWQQRRDPIWEQ